VQYPEQKRVDPDSGRTRTATSAVLADVTRNGVKHKWMRVVRWNNAHNFVISFWNQFYARKTATL